MKKTFLFFSVTLALVAFIYSCGSDTTTNTTNTSGITSISGTVSNWTGGSNKKAYARVYDSTHANHLELDSVTISSAGAFSLNLREVPAMYLSTYKVDTTNCTGSINVSSSSIKSTFLDIEVRDSLGNNLGTLERRNYDSTLTKGSVYMMFNYYSAAVTASGTEVCSHGLFVDTTSINLSEVAGWNKDVYLVNNAVLGAPTSISVTNAEPGSPSPAIVWKFVQ